ncbi:hypothetical protein FA95DRAFT_1552250 [Auriscalpium vulgare]|uniref:Uncharacterized protein n=1 Tax=Auriscalpium vulgare TaxID=40419 RepID=A0ACB8SC13_9AGAM|nr:hypothetical protein FA95DRAFT_1552250 [Auriscalpium vulgare]
MPPRAQPKIFQILVKTHKLTVFCTFPSSTTLGPVKEEVFSALTDGVAQRVEFPTVSSLDDFVLARELKEKGQGTGRYEALRDSQVLKDVANNWDVLYIQFKSQDGELLPIEVTLPSLNDDDEEESIPIEYPEEMDLAPDAGSSRKGKRKAPSN